MERQVIAALALAGLLMLAGCIGAIPGEGINVKFFGDMENSEKDFHMNGNVSVGGGTSDDMTLDNVAVELYTVDGELIHREPLGQFAAPYGSIHVSITIADHPKYVLLTSPDFWSDPVYQVTWYEQINETNYGIRYASSPNDFPEVIREQKDG